MTYRVVIPKRGSVEFKNYQAMLDSLRRYRNLLDNSGFCVEELDDEGNVHAIISNKELRIIVAEMEGLGALSVPGISQKDT